MFRIEFTNYTNVQNFKAIDDVSSMVQYKTEEGKIRLDVIANTILTIGWVEFYSSDDFVIDIVPVQG